MLCLCYVRQKRLKFQFIDQQEPQKTRRHPHLHASILNKSNQPTTKLLKCCSKMMFRNIAAAITQEYLMAGLFYTLTKFNSSAPIFTKVLYLDPLFCHCFSLLRRWHSKLPASRTQKLNTQTKSICWYMNGRDISLQIFGMVKGWPQHLQQHCSPAVYQERMVGLPCSPYI